MVLDIRSGFYIFGREIPFYGICMTVGFLLGGALAVPRGKKYGISKLDVIYAACFAAVGGIVGAKLLAVVVCIPQLINGTVKFVSLLIGGFVFYGGLIGGVGGLLIYAKVYKFGVLDFFDVFAPSVPAGHALGRLGCFLAGCCYGIQLPEGSAFAIIYPESYAARGTPTGVPLLPTQLMEMAILLVLYAALEILYYRTGKKGAALFTYVISYGVIRFVLEFFRGDAVRGIAGGLSTSQWISLAIILAAGVGIFFVYFYPKVKNGSQKN